MNHSYSQHPPPYPPPPPYGPPPGRRDAWMEPYLRTIRRRSNIIGGGLLMLQGISLAVYQLLFFAFDLIPYNALPYAMWELIGQTEELVSYILCFWIPTAFMVSLIGIPAKAAFPLKRPRASIAVPAVFVCLGASMLGTYASNFLATILYRLFGVVPVMMDMPVPEGLAANILYVISLVVAPAIFEELMFRGVVLQSLRQFGDGFALAMSSILFAMLHGNLVQGPNTLLLGFIIGYFVLRTGSLLTGMLVHLINNGLTVAYTYLELNLSYNQTLILDYAMIAAYILLGVVSLVYLIFRHGGLFQLAASDYPIPAPKRYGTFFLSISMLFFIALTAVLIVINMRQEA